VAGRRQASGKRPNGIALDVARLTQVYRITYPNGKIYVGMDLTGAITYFGSPSNKKRIAADLAEHRLDLTARKEILWESETATDAEVRAMERKFIVETGANDPAIGYNLWPRWTGANEKPQGDAPGHNVIGSDD